MPFSREGEVPPSRVLREGEVPPEPRIYGRAKFHLSFLRCFNTLWCQRNIGLDYRVQEMLKKAVTALVFLPVPEFGFGARASVSLVTSL